MGALIPLALSLAPEIGKWLFGSKGADVATAVTGVVQAVTGTTDDQVASAAIARDPALAAQVRMKLAELAAQQEIAARQADLDTLKTLMASDQAQNDTNKADATSQSLFVAGWRPFIGWICGCGVGWTFLAAPLLAFWSQRPVPNIDTSQLLILLQGMLGLGAMRTWEKLKGATGGKG